MSSDQYALANAWELADRRLDALESAHDATTMRRLRAAGVQPGWRCLEVGAGRGSIARWLGTAVAPHGQVIALDIDARFLRPRPAAIECRSQRVPIHCPPDRSMSSTPGCC